MQKKRRKIAYVTGTRADFDLITPTLKSIDASPGLELHVYATGMHLMKEFGYTFNQVREEFPRAKKISATFEYDKKAGAAHFIGNFISALTSVFDKSRPDLVLVLGDRPEMLGTATACLYLGIPVVHIHGGDKSATVDDPVRHAITKLAHLHFPATKESARRIRNMGEEAWRIHTVGAPALDTILREKLPPRTELLKKLDLNPDKNFLLVTQHPVSEEIDQAEQQITATLAAVKKINLPTVVIYPNADAGGRKIIKIIERERRNPLFRIFPSLPYRHFLALEREAAAWIGNSSGAMVESASFKTPVINIGTRQNGRQHGKNVIHTDHDAQNIANAIHTSLHDKRYLRQLKKITNPWGDGNTGPRIAKILERITIDSRLLTKQITY